MNEHYQNLRIAMLDLIEQIKTELSQEDINESLELIEHNEFGCSFELICTQLFEYDKKISPDVYKKIESIGQSMKMEETVWGFLKN